MIVGSIQLDPEFCSPLSETNTYTGKVPFKYSYHCSSAVLTAYLVPLIMLYVMSGLVVPLLKMSMYLVKIETSDKIMSYFCCSKYKFCLQFAPFSTSILAPKFVASKVKEVIVTNPDGSTRNTQGTRLTDVGVSKESLFDPSLTLQKYITLPLTILLTFGISAPLLGLAIFISIFAQKSLGEFMIGKYLWHAVDHDDDGNIDDTIMVEKNLTLAVKGLSLMLTEHEVLTVQSCWGVMLFFIGAYWGFMFYDMVADENHSTQLGVTVLLLMTFLYPIIIYFLRMFLQGIFSSCMHLFVKKVIIRNTSSKLDTVILNDNAIRRATRRLDNKVLNPFSKNKSVSFSINNDPSTDTDTNTNTNTNRRKTSDHATASNPIVTNIQRITDNDL